MSGVFDSSDIGLPEVDPEHPPTPKHLLGQGSGSRKEISRGLSKSERLPKPEPTSGTWGSAGAPDRFDPGAATQQVPIVKAEKASPELTSRSEERSHGQQNDEQQPLEDLFSESVLVRSVGLDESQPDKSGELGQPDVGSDEPITVSGGVRAELPHWTDPPTGEVPVIIPEGSASRTGDAGDGPEPSPALVPKGLRWRDEADDWDDSEPFDVYGLSGSSADDDTKGIALSDRYSFEDDFEKLGFDDLEEMTDEEPSELTGATLGRHHRRSGTSVDESSRPPAAGSKRHASRGERSSYKSGSSISTAVGVGAMVGGLFVVCYGIGPKALAALVALGITGCAAEFYRMLQGRGFKPATLMGLVGSLGIVLAAYWRGQAALPAVGAVVTAGILVWYLARVVEARPLVNIGLSVLVFAWVGGFGSYASLLLREPNGKHLLLGVIAATVVADVAAWFVGSKFGSRPLAPAVSPGKTWEGTIGGGVGAIIMGLVIGHFLSPWGGTLHGLLLGLVVAVVGPIGDLAQSMIKRDLGVKDSGDTLPGHGGLFDRFDALIMVLPATFYLALLLHIAS